MKKRKVSITFTVLIWVGMLLAILGAVVAALGLGDSTLFEGSLGDFKIKTSQVGLVILAIGAALSYFTSQNLPSGTTVLGDSPTLLDRVKRNLPVLSLLAFVIAVVLLVLSYLV